MDLNQKSDKYNWSDTKNMNLMDKDFKGDFLKTDLGVFVVQSAESTGFFDKNKPNEAYLSIYKDISDIDVNKPPLYIKSIDNIDVAKRLSENTIDFFTNNKDLNFNDVKEHLNASLKNTTNNLSEVFINNEKDKYLSSLPNNNSKEIEIARKSGYVQGVCECVAAIGEDHTLGKKLLSEMKVDKDMAKKYANPETFKTLEQGIFAQQPERKHELEQTQSFKL